MTHTFVVDVTQQDAFAEADYPTVVTLINSKQSTVRPLPLSDSGRADIAVLLTRHHSGVARVQRHHASTPVTRRIERAHDHRPQERQVLRSAIAHAGEPAAERQERQPLRRAGEGDGRAPVLLGGLLSHDLPHRRNHRHAVPNHRVLQRGRARRHLLRCRLWLLSPLVHGVPRFHIHGAAVAVQQHAERSGAVGILRRLRVQPAVSGGLARPLANT